MNRRLLIIIASVIVLLGLILASYFLFFRGNGGVAVGPNPFGSAGDKDPVEGAADTGVPIPDAGDVIAPRLLKLADGPVAKGFAMIYYPPVVTGRATSTATE